MCWKVSDATLYDGSMVGAWKTRFDEARAAEKVAAELAAAEKAAAEKAAASGDAAKKG